MESPSQKLAERIVTRLVQEGLLSAERGKKLQDKLPSGDVKSEDWKSEVDLSTAPSRSGDINEQ